MQTARYFVAFSLAAVALCCASVFAQPTEGSPAKTLHLRARVVTSQGDIVVELNAEVAPLTVINFIEYAREGFYEGTVFHRVTDRVIQGGAYTPDMDDKTKGLRDPIPVNESRRGLNNERGAFSMYREPYRTDSAKAQFFINLQDNVALDSLKDGYGYAVFGKVVEGMDVVEKIAKLPTSTHPKYAAGRNPVVPKELPVIQSVQIIGELDRPKAFEVAADYAERIKDPIAYRIRELEKQYGAKAVRTESGLVYIDVKEGTGAFPLDEDTVEIEFVAFLVGGGRKKPFDSSTERWDGLPGKVLLNGLIPGFREGLGTMREGGKRILILPPNLGHGDVGVPGRVPGGATTEYEVDLLGALRDKPGE